MSAPPSISVAVEPEAVEHFDCFGGTCAVLVQGRGPAGSAPQAVVRARRRLLEWHGQFSRFDPNSELCQLNQDPRESVPVSAMMSRFVEAALSTAFRTGGLVDPTLVDEVERVGYAEDFGSRSTWGHLGPSESRSSQTPSIHSAVRVPGRPHPDARWRQVTVDRRAGIVTRPPGVRLDSGGVAKGLFGDVLAPALSRHESFAIVAAGDIRFGGTSARARAVQVTSPFDDGVLHTFELARGAVATSGITRRSWLDAQGRPAHHLLDPATGRPAFTGIVQATALAPTGVEAEALAKAALLSGPEAAAGWLIHGGLVVYDDGGHDAIEPGAGSGSR